MGFACRKLATCQVWFIWGSRSYGYQWFGDRTGGRHCGDIVIPSVSVSRWRKYESVLDVLRHEYGHAYADINGRRINTKRFERAFGGPHDVNEPHPVPEDPDVHVTPYAATTTGEDFAETFWLYLKHKGRPPARLKYKTAILRKWRFIEDLAR